MAAQSTNSVLAMELPESARLDSCSQRVYDPVQWFANLAADCSHLGEIMILNRHMRNFNFLSDLPAQLKFKKFPLIDGKSIISIQF